ncbi:MAG: methyltransferase [Microcoleaceae cyanobacterium]
MGLHQFQFKQFTILQDRCGMKVTTDGVLLGAWTNPNGVGRILDIGTGTGLIALMLAQRCTAQIDGVEIDGSACLQAQENVARSSWQHQVKVYHSSLQDYTLNCPHLYDLIVCNPPFFTNVSKAATPARTLARHNDKLTLTELFFAVNRLLTKEGRMTMIYPYIAANQLKENIKPFGLFLNKIVALKTTPQAQPKRILIELSRQPVCLSEQSLVVQTNQHHYTPEFIELVRDFYLKY